VTDTSPSNRAEVVVRSDLATGVLPAVVAMIAARAEFPLDRLDEALLLTDAVAAHAPARSRDGVVSVQLSVDEAGLRIAVAGLAEGGAAGLLTDATLPDVGGVLERLADEVQTSENDGEGEQLVLRIAYDPSERLTVDNGR
jgi:serine/threonine-protein kinase RsbW